ncbi:hypothetical protein ACI77O_12355 [Pseudomonas tritici]|uniref:hypothetical protein n=1 Tax=Pseudomonas tritici TaxID=2745518 RepID=UPI00387A92E2
MEYLVTLHADAGDVRTAYTENKQEQAVSLWQSYVADGKRASLTIESAAGSAADSAPAAPAGSYNRSYADYAEAMTAFDATPITEAGFHDWQAHLPAAIPVSMPLTLNSAIGMAIEAGDLYGATDLINKCDEHDQDCWSLYTTEGSHFPAGGLWFNHLDWMNRDRPDATPLTVAYMLDFDGSLPSQLVASE